MLAFIHIHKTAGQTVHTMLRSSFGARHCDVEPWLARRTGDPHFTVSVDDLRYLRRFYPRLESIAGARIRPYADLDRVYPEIKYFALMRDPLKRCASLFQYLTREGQNRCLVFEEWIQRDWQRNRQTQMIAGSPEVSEAIRLIREKEIFVGLTECFDESMLLFRSLMAPALNISHEPVNVAQDNSLAENLLDTERTRQMIVEANQADLELYTYVKDELYPAYRRQYGGSLAADLARYQVSRGTFNRRNVLLSRLKRNLLYKPMLHLYRQGARV
jgi:hypothetical protein